MVDKVSECIVIILDTSRSMYRSDYSPNRLEACKAGILNFIQSRHKHDTSSSFALVTYNENAEVIFDIPDGALELEFSNYLKEIKCAGTSVLGEGIGKGIKLLIEDIRKAGAKLPRILIFSDGKYTQGKVDPMKMAQLAQQLGIKIDTFRLGEVEHFNIMKRLSEVTEGKYIYSNDGPALIKAAIDMGEANIDAHGAAYRKSKAFTTVLKQIAQQLMTENELMNQGSDSQKDLLAKIRGTKSFQKCSICFCENDPVTKGSFSVSGRYCPNCATPMHMTCASMWAKNNNKESDGTVFRCPHCFYLLKIPAAVQTAAKLHQEVKADIKATSKSSPQEQYFAGRRVIARNLGDQAMYSACPVCNGIFDENETVVTCGNPNCNAIYHENCYPRLPNMICKVCNSHLS